jgi:hypothetical protein
MFSILCDVVTDTLQQILNDAERFPITVNTRRRHAAGCFIAMYAALRDLEIALTNAMQAFNHIASGHQTPIKIVIRRKLDTLLECVDNFGEKAILLHALPLFAHINPYLAGTEAKGWSERPPYSIVNLFPLACPTPILENGKASYFVEFPTVAPSRKLLPHKSLGPSGAFGKDKEYILRYMRKQLSFQTIDIRDQGSIQHVLAKAPQDIQHLEDMRKEFANFIKHQFPLDEILT